MTNAHWRWLWGIGATSIMALAAILVFRPSHTTMVVEVRREALTLRDGRLYRSGDTTPFSGVMTEFYPNSSLCSRSQVNNGLLEGISEGWHTNGQMQVREHFVAGVSHGQRIKWHLTGQKLSEATIVHGKMEGWFRRWNENGSLFEEIPMKAGQPDGLARSFFASGFLKAEARLRNGQVLEQHFWKDGEHPDSAPLASASHHTKDP